MRAQQGALGHLKVVEDGARHGLGADRPAGRVSGFEGDLGVLRGLIRVINAGETLNLARSRQLVQSLGVPCFAHLQGDLRTAGNAWKCGDVLHGNATQGSGESHEPVCSL